VIGKTNSRPAKWRYPVPVSRFDYRTIRQLLLFAVVCEEGSFRRAATRLNISQPPLTAQIDELENRLRVRLLERSPRGVKLTSTGLAFLPEVQKFISQAEQLDRSLKQIRGGQRGIVTIGAVTEAMLEWVPACIARVRAEHPLIAVYTKSIDSVEIEEAVANNEVSFAIGYCGSSVKTGLQSFCLRLEKPVVLFSETHPLAKVDTITWDDLKQESWVFTPRTISPNYFDALYGLCKENGFTPDIRYEMGSVMQQIAFVCCGQGTALIPESFVKWIPKAAIAKPIQNTRATLALTAVWNPAVHSVHRDTVLQALGVAV